MTQVRQAHDQDKMSTKDACEALAALPGFTPQVIRPPTPREKYYDQSTIIVCPTRRTKFCAECGAKIQDEWEKCEGTTEDGPPCGAQIGGRIDFQVLDSWLGLVAPMNQNREGPIFALEHREKVGTGPWVEAKTPEQLVQRDGPLIAVGYEVGKAYNALIEGILASPGLKDHKFLLTVEDDNILPWDAQMKLLDAMIFARTEDGRPYDAISALYHTKESAHIPMAFGDAVAQRKSGKPVTVASYKPIDPADYPPEQKVISVLGIPCGCAIWRLSLFREIPRPWFLTKENTRRNRLNSMTQDLYFSLKCAEAGKNLGLARDIWVGHKSAEGTVY